MGVFEFVVMLVLITTIGKVLSGRREDRHLSEGTQADAAEIERLRGAIDDMSTRLSFLEEERDFYRDLLEAPAEPRGLPASDDPSTRPPTGDAAS